ncbi:diguanylate cyclase (GGDEF)-like protein [Orenia metallireducens]|jgi:diguanylate cyclase (GGDEF)-like protein|uniref:Diguanylate cyclase (GGDEF) domain-containing protein n=1 Tax=Orenia metallireducens TaxID=1413210 RepID=A0A285IF06_9FIRM|nr:sensor domain-containing diguanylate cyclase [Orenia metallireducens]PRX18520.1 diguanylate cyclase (GGDEF)-like protein [Orenia metallireducens]SNY46559.1 diguanylate cyclase (GGDEF) domain-containing protein [Orenia metallireducens]
MAILNKLLERFRNNQYDVDSAFNTLLVIMVVATTFIITLIGISSYYVFKDNLLDVSTRQLHIIARETASNIYDSIVETFESSAGKNTEYDHNRMLLYNLNKFRKIISSADKEILTPLNFKGEIYLLDDKGQVILHSDPTQEDRDYSKQSNFKDIIADKRSRTMYINDSTEIEEQGETNVRDNSQNSRNGDAILARVSTSGYGDYKRDGKGYIFSYGKVASSDLIVVVEAEQEIIYAGARKIGLVVFVLGAIAILIISVIAFVVSRKYSKQQEQLQRFASLDALTGVLNRRTGLNLLETQLNVIKSREGKLTICFVDIDGLKGVNDKFGHNEGDNLIYTVSNIFKESIRDNDIICRMGGDEFLLVFPECDLKRAQRVWKRVQRKFEEINSTEEREYIISASHGFVEYDGSDSISLNELIEIADDRMYEDKRCHKKERCISQMSMRTI